MAQPTVAILGASADRSKFGNKSVRAHAQQGYHVYPVNPKGGEIEGWPVYRSLTEIPEERLDRVSVYLAPRLGLSLLEQIAAKPCGEVWFNPGSESTELAERARALGIEPVLGCSIVDLGVYPSDFPDD